jgi:hypothetical protein
MSSDNQYTALGPAIIGFQTSATNIDVGAEISGNKAGIRGSCVAGIGVRGESVGQEGVHGQGTPGMLGIGIKNGTTGHNGVMGLVEGAEGAGVYGAHGQPGHPLDVTAFPVSPAPGAGVFGVSDEANGVLGTSHTGIGVRGTSDRSRGGEFESSPTVAQIRLVPIAQNTPTPAPELPKDGRVGDLLLIRNRFRNADQVEVEEGSLWLCVPRNLGTDASDLWKPVLLGAVVVGTI